MQTQFVDLYRNGIQRAAEVARVTLENIVRLQEKQLETARALLEEQSRSAGEIARAGSMEELLTLQSRFATAQLGRMVEFWTNAWQATAQQAARSSEDVARTAANQVSRSVGSIGESGDAANHDRKAQRKSA